MANSWVEGYFNNPEYSDITIKFSGREIKAHKIVLSNRSDYFKSAFNKKSNFKEASQAEMELFEDDPKALEAMLKWMYDGVLPDDDYKTPIPGKIDFDVCKVAKKYAVDALYQQALSSAQTVLCFEHIPEAVASLQYGLAQGIEEKDLLSCLLNSRAEQFLENDDFCDLLMQHPIPAIEFLINLARRNSSLLSRLQAQAFKDAVNSRGPGH